MPELLIIEKFGGGGSQNAEYVERNVQHMVDEHNLVAAVFSGPGGTSGRATERTIQLTQAHATGQDYQPMLDELEQQFSTVAPTAASQLVGPALDEIRQSLDRGYGYDWLKARPEHFQTSVYRFLLDQAGVEVNEVNPVNSIYADRHGRLDLERTQAGLWVALKPNMLNLIPGFSAMNPEWNMVNISRGSTDIVAAATATTFKLIHPDAQVDLILRKDEVYGIMQVGPKIHKSAAVAPELSISEVETLTLGGAEVVHPAVMSFIDGSGVRLLVRNTFDINHLGTAIVPITERTIDPDQPVVGIANKSVVAYKWQEPTTDALPGSVEAVSGVFTKLGIPITEIQSSSGGVIKVYISEEAAKLHGSEVKTGLLNIEGSDNSQVTVEEDLELVVLAGEALRESYAMLKVAGKLEQIAEDTSTEVTGFWSSGGEPNLYVTVPKEQSIEFMRNLYRAFFPKPKA